MAALLSPNAKQQFFDNAGNPAAGFKLYTYAAGTTTPRATYSNRAGAVANTNPIILDARGEATIYLSPDVVYDYVLKTADDATVWTREGVSLDTGVATTVVYEPDGTGALIRNVQTKLRETPSVKDFGALGDGTTDDTAAIESVNAEATPVFIPEGDYISTVEPTVPVYGPGRVIINGIEWKRKGNVQTNLYRKKELFRFDDRFSMYDALKTTYGYGNFYTRGAYLDDANGILYVSTSPGAPNPNNWAWMVVYDMATGEELSIFSAGDEYAKSFAVVDEGASRFLYTTGAGESIEKYDITTLPANGTRLTPVETISGIRTSFVSEWAGRFYYQYNFATRNSITTNNTIIQTDSDFNRTGQIDLPWSLAGTTDGAFDYLPKMQGMAFGPNGLVCSYGGRYMPGTDAKDTKAYQGLRVFSPAGHLVADTVMDPDRMLDVFAENGFTTLTRVEYEGLSVSKRGRVISTVHTTGFTVSIFEEFSDAPDAIDFSTAASPMATPVLGDTWFPKRTDETAGIVDPFTGTSMTEVLDFVKFSRRHVVPRICFASSSTGPALTNLTGNPLPGAIMVDIQWSSATTWFVDMRLANYYLRYVVTYDEGTDSWSYANQPAMQMTKYRDGYGNNRVADVVGAAIPTTGDWEVGDRITLSSPADYAGAVCTVAGSPGTWRYTDPVDTGWTALTPENSWSNLGGYATAAVRKVGKHVTLRGVIGGGTTTDATVVCTLPAGYRPPSTVMFPAGSASSTPQARLAVYSDGTVKIFGISSDTYLSLSNINFFVD